MAAERYAIGLDLGGDTAEAVALAILAEIQAALHQKTAISRGMTTEDFLAAPDRQYIPAQCSLDPRQPTHESDEPVDAIETAR